MSEHASTVDASGAFSSLGVNKQKSRQDQLQSSGQTDRLQKGEGSFSIFHKYTTISIDQSERIAFL